MSETIGAIAPALVKAQAEIKPITKDSTNPAFRSKYTSLDAIMEVVRPVLAKNGLIVVQSVLDTIDGEHSTSIMVESRVIHASGEWIAGVVQVPVMQQTSHGFGSALSYGRRYSISALLSLASDEDDDGNNIRLPHLGGVIIGNYVEIGSLTTVCSGTIEPTRISNHCKIDDHVHIAHNIVMDDNCIIVACAEISGSVHLEPGVWVGPNSATVEGLTLAADTLLGVGAVVTRSTEPNGIYAGNPAKRLRDRFANPPITPKAKE
jgi:acetyltransferase-like isoleucine patch superfamily enzyme